MRSVSKKYDLKISIFSVYYIDIDPVYTKIYKDFNEAKLAIFAYIEGWYNRKRLHSAINYMTPDQCEALARNMT